jgi:hypothetical protein
MYRIDDDARSREYQFLQLAVWKAPQKRPLIPGAKTHPAPIGTRIYGHEAL